MIMDATDSYHRHALSSTRPAPAMWHAGTARHDHECRVECAELDGWKGRLQFAQVAPHIFWEPF